MKKIILLCVVGFSAEVLSMDHNKFSKENTNFVDEMIEATRTGNPDLIYHLKSLDDNNPPIINGAYYEFANESIPLLITMGENINSISPKGNTALMSTVSSSLDEKLPATKALLEAGALINLTNNWGMTALMLAAASSNIKTIKLLIDYGAEINKKDNSGKTALDYAINPYFDAPDYNENRENSVKFLIGIGAKSGDQI